MYVQFNLAILLIYCRLLKLNCCVTRDYCTILELIFLIIKWYKDLNPKQSATTFKIAKQQQQQRNLIYDFRFLDLFFVFLCFMLWN